MAVAYTWTGGWYDLVRNDSLFLALGVGGLYTLAVGHRHWRLVALAGVLLGLAFFAKQTADAQTHIGQAAFPQSTAPSHREPEKQSRSHTP